MRGQLQKQIVGSNLENRIRILGPILQKELPDWYRSANVVVLPSFTEGVPNVLLEATACGTPFVASRVGGIPEITHLGVNLLVPPGNSQALADAIRQFLTPACSGPVSAVAPMRSHAQAASELAHVFEKVLQTPRRVATLATAP
jgi:glycosyltransferase involved in cell wall biosynthesis